MTSERSESSYYLETDSAEKSKGTNSSEERKKKASSRQPQPHIVLNDNAGSGGNT